MLIGVQKENKIEYTEKDKGQLLYDPKIRAYSNLGEAISFLRKQRRTKVGFTNGTFKILTPAHVVFLGLCKTQCDILIVGVNSDYSLRVLNRESPFSDKERAFCLANLNTVDYVTLFDGETPFEVISHLSPDVIFKGYDYEDKEVVSAGKPVCIVKHPFNVHTSDILKHKEKVESKFFKIDL